jgi:hypothetical protein
MEKVLKVAKKKIKAHLKAQEFKDVLPICEVSNKRLTVHSCFSHPLTST